MRKEAVNFETLKQILVKQPKMIHISCHGDYDHHLDQFYLALEEKDNGILDKLTEERLGNLLGDDTHHQVHLAFVSACHSEMIGNIFLRAKIPVVVAVNSHSLILDEVCQLFARHFYYHLLDGYSPKIAFNEAQKVVQGSNIQKNSCCCAHDHKQSCKWQKYAMKYGYERAHEIHTPNCQCNFPQNYHAPNCEFYRQFIAALQEFEDCTYLDESDLPSSDDYVTVCCCQSSLPHDESIKFVLKGSEEAKEKILFKNRQAGALMVEADVNLHNKLPQVIDNQMLVGRNKELQKIVQYLFSDISQHRLIHIYGSEGVGKGSIAKYAAKYTLDRRKFTDGVYYIEVQNRNSGQGLISKICQKLMLPNFNREQLCDIIKSSHILIIIDKCKKLIEQSPSSFNKTLKEIVENTTYAKLLVVSRKMRDISDDLKFKIQVEVPDLSKFNAAKLLRLASQGSKHMKQFQKCQDLMQHSIFKYIPYKPSGILQMAPLLYEKSLDDIVREKEQELQDARSNKLPQIIGSHQMEYGEFSWIMNISYRDLHAKFSLELNLLYLLCQAPAGLTESDIYFICNDNRSLYGEWQPFLQAITQDDSQSKLNPTSMIQFGKITRPETSFINERFKAFRLVTSNYCEELQEIHYIPQPIVSEYINTLVLKSGRKTACFKECFRFLSRLSRQLLRSIKVQKKKEIDLYQVSAEIDIGIWSDTHTTAPISEQELEISEVDYAEAKFLYNESNFTTFLDLDLLKVHFEQLDFKNEFFYQLDELCQNIPSILMMLKRQEDAIILIDKCKQICNYYELSFTKAKLLLIQSSIFIQTNIRNYEISNQLDQAESIFMDLRINEGISEALFLKALTFINDINGVNVQHQAYRENSFTSSASSLSTLVPYMEHSNSSDTVVFETRLNHQFSGLNQTPSNHSFSNHQLLKKGSLNLPRKAEDILQSLRKARKFFRQVKEEFGIAKTNLIEAEFQIEKSQGMGVHLEYDPQNITTMLSEAMELFQKFGCESQRASCLRNLAKLNYQLNDNFEAKKHIDNALDIIRKLQDKLQEPLANALLNKILHRIRIHSHNVFIFSKAFPLVEIKPTRDVTVVGTFTRYPSDFRRRIHKTMKQQRKVVNLKFDNLTIDILQYVKTYGCRVLHVSSDVYRSDCLCIEGKNGAVVYLDVNQLISLLKSPVGRLNVDVVVVAIPQSSKIAEAFVKLGVPHVICFDFNQKLQSTFMDNLYTLPKRYDCINDFCVEFYKNLVQEMSVYKSWKMAKMSLNNRVTEMGDNMDHQHLTEQDLGKGPLLLPEKGNHKLSLFNSNSEDERKQLQNGSILDSTKVRGPTNVVRPNTPFTGRQKEIHRVISAIKNDSIHIINVIGIDGIGKTRFLQEAAFYMTARSEFQDGIFMVDLCKVKTVEQINQRLKDINIGGGQSLDLHSNIQEKKVLLIFENIDCLLKNSKTQFNWWLMSLAQQWEDMKIIMTSKKEINLKSHQKLYKLTLSFKLKTLNDIEAVDMILSNCKRQITKDELLMHEDTPQNIHQQLQQESSVKNCCGLPYYLKIFSQFLKKLSFDNIDIRQEIPDKKKGQMRRLQKDYQPHQQSSNNVDTFNDQQESRLSQSSPTDDVYMPSDSRRLYGNIQATKIANRLIVLPGNNLSSHVIKEVKEDLSGSSGTLKNEMGSKILQLKEVKKADSFQDLERHSTIYSKQSQLQEIDPEYFKYDQNAQYNPEVSPNQRRSSDLKESNLSEDECSNGPTTLVYQVDGEKKQILKKDQLRPYVPELDQSDFSENLKRNQRERQSFPSQKNDPQLDPVTDLFKSMLMNTSQISVDGVKQVSLIFQRQRTDSLRSGQQYTFSEQRSRSDSGPFDNNTLRTSKYGNIFEEPQIARSGQQVIKEVQVDQRQEEEKGQNNSRIRSDIADAQFSLQNRLVDSNLSQTRLGLDDLESIDSEKVESENLDDGDQSYEQENLQFTPQLSHKVLSRQKSAFTTNSVQKSDSFSKSSLSIFKCQRYNSKNEKIIKDKQIAKQEFGPRTGRHAHKYKKLVKNQSQQIKQQQQEERKLRKQAVITQRKVKQESMKFEEEEKLELPIEAISKKGGKASKKQKTIDH